MDRRSGSGGKRNTKSFENYLREEQTGAKKSASKSGGGGVKPKSKAPYADIGFRNEFAGEAFSEAAETEFSSEINGSIRAYEAIMDKFQRQYLRWNIDRKCTLSELEQLVEDVHKDQLQFNNTNLFFKQINVESRCMKTNDDSALDFIASMAALVTDAIGGVNSFAQACNVDEYMKKFGAIMEKDAETTKPLYAARSSCFERYKNVEEIIRRYHSDTFGSTINKISRSLKTEDMWLDLKDARSGDSVTQVFETLDAFFRQISKAEVFNGICKSVESYVDSNPAVLDACESTGKALYGIYDTWGRDTKNSNALVSRSVSSVANRALIRREESEVSRLRHLVSDEERPQAKLETKIREAIMDLEREAEEMKNLFESSTSFTPKKGASLNYDYSKCGAESYDSYDFY